MIFRTQYDPAFGPLEHVSSKSETVPDMSLTVKDILIRFQRGTLSPDEICRNVDYEDDPDIDNPYDPPTDLTDYDAMARRGHSILQNMAAAGRSGPETQAAASPASVTPPDAAAAAAATES
nr:MAG: hypothetical protein [Microvirus sp.]QQL13308.1 MAG: hypothetical protein [Microviridae sp.]